MVLVKARNLKRQFPAPRSVGDILLRRYPSVRAVDGVDLEIARGESVGLLGESGCGKTTIGRLLVKLLEPSAGEILFDDKPLAALSSRQVRGFRQRAQLVFQNPYDAINPRFTIERALAEPLRNLKVAPEDIRDRIEIALLKVRLPKLRDFSGVYPHELSGGQLQRIVLARAIILEPQFLVADEPVSMLDVSVRTGVLNVLRQVKEQLDLSALYISHDLTLVRYICTRAIVMYLGVVVESGPTEELLKTPQHPYTKALVQAVPVPRVDQSREPLPIKDSPDGDQQPLSGCRFRNRCPYAVARCAEETPALRSISPNRVVACHLV